MYFIQHIFFMENIYQLQLIYQILWGLWTLDLCLLYHPSPTPYSAVRPACDAPHSVMYNLTQCVSQH